MITFEELRISNYLTIQNLDFKFENGLTGLRGKNGSGKTSTLTAIQMALFNKNMRNPKGNIEDTYNKHTNLPYKIYVKFNKDGKIYEVTNDRAKNNITILEDGANISPKGIKLQLAKIESILSVDFTTFSSLTFISQNTLTQIFDLTSSENLLYQFLDIDLLTFLEKGLKAKQSELKRHLGVLTASMATISRQESMLKGFEKVDTEILRIKQSSLQESLLLLNDSDGNVAIKAMKDQEEAQKRILQGIREKYLTSKAQLDIHKEHLEKLESGTCPVCGQSVGTTLKDIVDKVESTSKQTAIYVKEGKAKEEQIKTLSDALLNKVKEFDDKKQEILNELNAVKGKILVVEEQQRNYNKLQASLDSLQERQTELKAEYEDTGTALNFCEASLSVIKSGAVTKEYVQNFVTLLNGRIKELVDAVNLPIKIQAENLKGSVNFIFTHKKVIKQYSDLSSGEKTKVSLLCMFSVLDTLELLTGTSFNILCLDELLSVVDTEGLTIFKTLLNRYRETKAVYLVSHHQEIEKEYFDTILEARIEDNATTIRTIN